MKKTKRQMTREELGIPMPSAMKMMPTPVKFDQRICFGIDWYATEEEAQIAAAEVRRKGRTYNGGLYDGKPCGREEV